MEESKKKFGYGLSITLGTIVIGLISYIFYTSNLLQIQNPTRCEYGGWAYAHKEIFNSLDGCNTCFCYSGEITCTQNSCNDSDGIQISTDKDNYKQGEIINISVTNNGKDPVYYTSKEALDFWSLEILKDGEWIDLKEISLNSLQFISYDTEKDFVLGDECSFRTYDFNPPLGLAIGENISRAWMQKTCYQEDDGSTKIRYINKDKYRISFEYSKNLSEDSQDIVNPIKIYSESFTIQ
jgi:hypothetical protein